MCTWAYAWFASRPSVNEYLPLLFIVAMLCDLGMVSAVAAAIFGGK